MVVGLDTPDGGIPPPGPPQVIELKLMLFASQATYCKEEGQESVP